jgi:hypothetical protein
MTKIGITSKFALALAVASAAAVSLAEDTGSVVTVGDKRVSAIVDDTTLLVSEPVVETKNAETDSWEVSEEESALTEFIKDSEEPYRGYISVATSMMFDCDGNGQLDSIDISNGAIDVDGDGVLDRCEYAIGDLNLNGVIDGFDVSILLGWWGVPFPQFGDLNQDGVVNAMDLGTLLGRFGVVVY